jgi:hypothetical protein
MISIIVQAWVLVLLSILLGVFLGKRRPLPKGFGPNAWLVVRVWVAVVVAQLVLVAIGEMFQASEEVRLSYLEFLLPLICGTLYARFTLKP